MTIKEGQIARYKGDGPFLLCGGGKGERSLVDSLYRHINNFGR